MLFKLLVFFSTLLVIFVDFRYELVLIRREFLNLRYIIFNNNYSQEFNRQKTFKAEFIYLKYVVESKINNFKEFNGKILKYKQ